MDHVERSKHKGLGLLGSLGGCFQPKNQVSALLSRHLVIPAHSRCFSFRNKSRKSSWKLQRRQSFRRELACVIILGVVGILGSELTLSSSLSPKEDEDKASEKGFLEAEEAETLLEEYFAM